MRKALFILAFCGFAVSLWAADPWVGTWKLSHAKSKLLPTATASTNDSVTVVREVDADTLEITATDIHKDGSKVVAWKCTVAKSGGVQNYQQGAPAKGISIVKTVIDAHTQHLTYLQNGKQVGLAYIILSKDGKTYTLSGISKDAQGKSFEEVNVYEKQ